MMKTPLQTVPRSVRAFENARAEVIRDLLVWLHAVWNPNRPMPPETWFQLYADRYADAVTLAQLEVVMLASWSVDHALELQGSRKRPAAEINPLAFVSTDGQGRPVLGQAYASAGQVGEAVAAATADGGTSEAAVALATTWRSVGKSLATATATTLSDTSRTMKSARMLAFDSAWIRVLTPPSCKRCVVLAGKVHRWATADFDRHPNCDCTQMPYDFDEQHPDFQGLIYDARTYFEQLDQAEQDSTFGKAAAQAIRDGADPNQVINARRGMATVTDRFGFRTVATTEGTTKRGWASRYLRETYKAKLTKQPGSRYRRTDRPRLMPEEIYKMARGDRDIAINLLHLNGYFLDASPSLSGKFDFFPRDREVAAAAARAREKLAARGVRAAA